MLRRGHALRQQRCRVRWRCLAPLLQQQPIPSLQCQEAVAARRVLVQMCACVRVWRWGSQMHAERQRTWARATSRRWQSAREHARARMRGGTSCCVALSHISWYCSTLRLSSSTFATSCANCNRCRSIAPVGPLTCCLVVSLHRICNVAYAARRFARCARHTCTCGSQLWPPSPSRPSTSATLSTQSTLPPGTFQAVTHGQLSLATPPRACQAATSSARFDAGAPPS